MYYRSKIKKGDLNFKLTRSGYLVKVISPGLVGISKNIKEKQQASCIIIFPLLVREKSAYCPVTS